MSDVRVSARVHNDGLWLHSETIAQAGCDVDAPLWIGLRIPLIEEYVETLSGVRLGPAQSLPPGDDGVGSQGTAGRLARLSGSLEAADDGDRRGERGVTKERPQAVRRDRQPDPAFVVAIDAQAAPAASLISSRLGRIQIPREALETIETQVPAGQAVSVLLVGLVESFSVAFVLKLHKRWSSADRDIRWGILAGRTREELSWVAAKILLAATRPARNGRNLLVTAVKGPARMAAYGSHAELVFGTAHDPDMIEAKLREQREFLSLFAHGASIDLDLGDVILCGRPGIEDQDDETNGKSDRLGAFAPVCRDLTCCWRAKAGVPRRRIGMDVLRADVLVLNSCQVITFSDTPVHSDYLLLFNALAGWSSAVIASIGIRQAMPLENIVAYELYRQGWRLGDVVRLLNGISRSKAADNFPMVLFGDPDKACQGAARDRPHVPGAVIAPGADGFTVRLAAIAGLVVVDLPSVGTTYAASTASGMDAQKAEILAWSVSGNPDRLVVLALPLDGEVSGPIVIACRRTTGTHGRSGAVQPPRPRPPPSDDQVMPLLLRNIGDFKFSKLSSDVKAFVAPLLRDYAAATHRPPIPRRSSAERRLEAGIETLDDLVLAHLLQFDYPAHLSEEENYLVRQIANRGTSCPACSTPVRVAESYRDRAPLLVRRAANCPNCGVVWDAAEDDCEISLETPRTADFGKIVPIKVMLTNARAQERRFCVGADFSPHGKAQNGKSTIVAVPPAGVARVTLRLSSKGRPCGAQLIRLAVVSRLRIHYAWRRLALTSATPVLSAGECMQGGSYEPSITA